MKNIFYFIFTILAFYGCHPAFAALSEADKAQIEAKNRLVNPGFENDKSGWTASGGTFTITTTSMEGKLSANWDSSASSQTFSGTAVTINDGLKNSNGYASCDILTATGVATHKLQVFDGTNVIAEKAITSSTTAKNTVEVNFIFPASGTVRPRLISVASNEPSIKIDNCKLQPASNIYQVSQTQIIGTLNYSPAANCRWQANNGSFSDYPVDNDCNAATTTGIIQALGSKKPGFRIPTVAPGTYLIKAYGSIRKDSTDTGNWPLFRFSDGTNSSAAQGAGSTATATATTVPVIEGTITYTSSQTNVDINLQSTSTNGSVSSEIYAESVGALTFEIYYFPSSAQTTVNISKDSHFAEFQFTFTSAERVGASAADPTVVSPAITVFKNEGFGTLSLSGAGLGVSVIPTKTGILKMCHEQLILNNTANNSLNLRIVDESGAVFPYGQIQGYMTLANSAVPISGCVTRTISAVGTAVEFKAQFWGNNGGTTYMLSAYSKWTLEWIAEKQQVPIFVGSVLNKGPTSVIIASASVDSTGTVIDDPEDMINGNCSLANTSEFTCTFNSGYFNGAPKCFAQLNGFGIAGYVGVTDSSSNFIAKTYSNAGAAATAFNFSILCKGNK